MGGHSYTGAFQGGNAGFIRLSLSFSYKKPGEKRSSPFKQTHRALSTNVAIKVLRDYVDSAKAFGSLGADGQESYDFFKNEVSSIVPHPISSRRTGGLSACTSYPSPGSWARSATQILQHTPRLEKN